jgi:hypothetical protein
MWKLGDVFPKAQQPKPAPAPEPRRQVECPSGKTPFYSKQEARMARRKILDLGTVTDMRPYRCSYCQLWHLGHKRGTY